ncbi:MAG: stage II sporulation protein R [Firmicutes bacterium]|nr:stage II sporulation protein R [Bacillota bacterium]
MKHKVYIALFLAAFVAAVGILSGCEPHTKTIGPAAPLLRLHIRADSNAERDQAAKLALVTLVTQFTEDALAEVTCLSEAKQATEKLLPRIKSLCDAYLAEQGFAYRSRAFLSYEFFPERSYENFVLQSGYYDALVITLGAGRGDNWWCVIYPPLCYIEAAHGGSAVYKSKIAEIFKKYF